MGAAFLIDRCRVQYAVIWRPAGIMGYRYTSISKKLVFFIQSTSDISLEENLWMLDVSSFYSF